MGCCQHNTDSTHRPRKSRFRQRVCPRKGCEAVYTPRSGNQRYCQDQQCLQEVRRWQAARRQKQRRLRPEVRKTQAAAATDNRTNDITTNRPFRDWGRIFDVDNTLATAMIDRLMHHGEAMVIQGSSFRTKGETPDE
ncbi:MAG: ATP-binding protein [Planctomyces sp.]